MIKYFVSVLLLPLAYHLVSGFQNENSPQFFTKEIECVGVLGDSVSAGFSIENGLYENRGKSFDIGGEEGYLTIPNLLKRFGGNKTCAAYGNTFITHSLKKYTVFKKPKKNDPEAHPNCNVAVSGALSNQLLKEFKDLLDEWLEFNCLNKKKVLTIMIGANDICDFCINGYQNTINTYENNLKNLFDKIQKNLVNTFVNVITTFDVGLTADFQTEHCKIIHYVINECPCILGRQFTQGNLGIVKKLYQDINKKLYLLVKNQQNFENKNGNKIVIQPIMEHFEIYNSSYLSEFDCFHPTEFGHQSMGTILWNNMFLPPEKKIKSMKYLLPIYEPSETDFLQ